MIIVSIAEAILINIRGVETIGAPAAIFAHPVFPRQLGLLSRKRISATATAASGHWVMATVMPQQLALLKALATTVAALVSASGGTRSNSRTLTIPSNAQPTTVASYLVRCIDQLDNTWDHSHRDQFSGPAA